MTSNILTWLHFATWTVKAATCRVLYHFQNKDELRSIVRSINANYANIARKNDYLLGKIKRWDIEERKVPVFDNDDIRAKRAMDIVELATGITFFQRGASRAEIENQDFGLVFTREKAAPAPPNKVDENCKGSVGESECSGCYPDKFCGDNGKFQKRLYVNLDGPKPNGGKADLEVTVHELAHALGLGDEIDGFGKGGSPFSIKMFCALKMLYQLPIGQEINAIKT